MKSYALTKGLLLTLFLTAGCGSEQSTEKRDVITYRTDAESCYIEKNQIDTTVTCATPYNVTITNNGYLTYFAKNGQSFVVLPHIENDQKGVFRKRGTLSLDDPEALEMKKLHDEIARKVIKDGNRSLY